jgi:hypothetical protein
MPLLIDPLWRIHESICCGELFVVGIFLYWYRKEIGQLIFVSTLLQFTASRCGTYISAAENSDSLFPLLISAIVNIASICNFYLAPCRCKVYHCEFPYAFMVFQLLIISHNYDFIMNYV